MTPSPTSSPSGQRQDDKAADVPTGLTVSGTGGAAPLADDNPDLQGEGNYVAGRRYNEATEQFVEDGKVEPAARDAAPDSAEQEAELEQAEEIGRSHAKK